MIYDKLTPLEYLEFVAGLWSIEPAVSETSAHQLLTSLGLEPHLHERCEGFSKGMLNWLRKSVDTTRLITSAPSRQFPTRRTTGFIMFESNFPPDKGQCSYQVIFNAFKRLAAPYSEAEKTALFSKTATDFYRLKLD